MARCCSHLLDGVHRIWIRRCSRQTVGDTVGCRALTGIIEVRILRPRVDDRSTTDSRARLEITLTGVAQSNGIAIRSQKLHENFSFAVRCATCRCAMPKRGAHADYAANGSFEMRLVSESTCQRNLRQPLPRGCHHEFGGLDSSRRDIRHGRGCKALFTPASKTGEPARQ